MPSRACVELTMLSVISKLSRLYIRHGCQYNTRGFDVGYTARAVDRRFCSTRRRAPVHIYPPHVLYNLPNCSSPSLDSAFALCDRVTPASSFKLATSTCQRSSVHLIAQVHLQPQAQMCETRKLKRSSSQDPQDWKTENCIFCERQGIDICGTAEDLKLQASRTA
ncbi:hypothetical protein EXIGLDRAFT_317783 [Exidia glandulosa HHB12029]|uniref:Uncharacterized protein n=1 Tax=Exidia glandulosa HHB12029 TaxID=1314781 RepID=A0A165CWI1_EXIGL|nr:hypothetical protein EXIGLDRAFT_317783 [Exidia glandulosa HHB12029]